jgi:hypothetical protein
MVLVFLLSLFMSLMQLANDAGASVLTRSDNAAAQLAHAQSEREATASQSGKLKGVIIYCKEELCT